MARKVATDAPASTAEVIPTNVNDFLGILKYRESWLEKHNEIGLTTGLAWTEVGGSLLVTQAHRDERQGPPQSPRQTGRRHAGVRASRDGLYSVAFARVRPAERLLSQ